MGNCYVLMGEEEFLQSREVDRIVSQARQNDPACERATHETSELSAGQLSEILGPSLFSSSRVVVLLNLQNAVKATAEALVQVAKDIPDETTLVVTHAGGVKGKAAVDALRKGGAEVIPCKPLTRRGDRLEFVRREITSSGRSLTPEAAELLVDAIGSELRQLASACSQLTATLSGQLDADAVRKYHGGRAEVTGFAVADAAMAGDTAGSLLALRHAINTGTDPVLVADALADGVRSVAKVASSSHANPGTLRMPPWKVDKMRRFARHWSPAALVQAMQVVAKANADVRGGSDDRVWALERTLLAMSEIRAAART